MRRLVMQKGKRIPFFFVTTCAGTALFLHAFLSTAVYGLGERTIRLPEPRHKGEISLEEALFMRRCERSYRFGQLSLEEVSQLVWAGGGTTVDAITQATMTYPSAGARYPLHFYVVVGEVEDVAKGVYHYKWDDHTLVKQKEGDMRFDLKKACFGQSMVESAAIDIVIMADTEKTRTRYGKKATRYVAMEAGHAAQNIQLEAAVLDLGTVLVGSFRSDEIQKVIGVDNQDPLYVIPIGKR
jgi:SagB-type dehydrogenase family enzyme